MKHPAVVIVLLVAPVWGLLAWASYELSQTRKAFQAQQQTERQVHEDNMRELRALRIKIGQSSVVLTQDLKELREEVSHNR